MQKQEYVERINSSYVGDDCCQIMLGHYPNEYLTIMDSTGVNLYCDEHGECIYNEYLYDVRRFEFPYANIPFHKSFNNMQKIIFTNQILDFDKIYLSFSNGIVTSKYAVKDGEEALLVTTLYQPEEKIQLMSHEEVSEYIKSFDQSFINPSDGKLSDYSFPSEEELLDRYKNHTRKLKKGMRFPNENMSKILERAIDELTLEDIPRDSVIFDGYYGVKTDGKEITDVKMITISYNEEDLYKVETLEIPLQKYTLQDVNNILKFQQAKNLEEPKFSRMMNRDIHKQDIINGKDKVYTLEKNQ